MEFFGFSAANDAAGRKAARGKETPEKILLPFLHAPSPAGFATRCRWRTEKANARDVRTKLVLSLAAAPARGTLIFFDIPRSIALPALWVNPLGQNGLH